MNRWKINRAKFYNFWYYSDQEFFMESGRALFRGHNGSGKSVTTQALITVLLDGNTSARRLDPFGKLERNIRDTVLGEKDIQEIDDRIGYVTMEFKKGNVYKTIGMGIEAHRGNNRATKQWYFILNGKRIGNHEGHFRLHKDEKIEGKWQRVPRTAKELEEALRNEGASEFFDRRDDYAEEVNKQLFGFETMESYQNYIQLLINTRSPKLSDTTNTDRLSELLTESLPPIAEEDLRPIFETFESIERIEHDLAANNEDLAAMMKLEAAFRKYHIQALAEKVVGYRDARSKLFDLENMREQLVRSIERNTSKIIKRTRIVKMLENKQSASEREKTSLRTDEVYSLQEKKSDLIKGQKETNEQLKNLRASYVSSRNQINQHLREIENLDYKLTKSQRMINETIDELQMLSDECYFEANETYIQHFRDTEGHYSFGAWMKEVEDHRDYLDETKMKLQEHDRLVEASKIAEQAFGDMQYKFDQAELDVLRLYGELESVEREIIGNIQEWHANLQVLTLTDDAVHRLIAGVAKADQVPHEVYMKEVQESYHVSHGLLINNELSKKHAQEKLTIEIGRINENIEKLLSQPEMEPTITERKRGDWSALIQEGISYIPFYEACEFKDEVPETIQFRIQDALSELGILAAVIVPEDKIEIASRYTAVVLPSPKKDRNLTEYLNPASENDIEIALITSILEGISVDEESEHYVSDHGHFRSGWLEGRATAFEEGLFIGKGAREALRLAKIKSLQDTLDALLVEENFLQVKLDRIEKQKERLVFEKEQFPSLDGYRKLENEKRIAGQLLEGLKGDLQQKRDQYELTEREASALLRTLQMEMRIPNIPRDLGTFSAAAGAAKEYTRQLGFLERTYHDQQSDKKQVALYNSFVKEKQVTLEDLWDQVCNEEQKVLTLIQEIKNTDEALHAIGADKVVQRLEKLSQLLEEIPKTRDRIRDSIKALELHSETKKSVLGKLMENDIPFQHGIIEAWQSALDEHRKLDVYRDEEDVDVSELPFEEAFTYLFERLAHKHDFKRSNIISAIDFLQATFESESVNLIQYSLTRETLRSKLLQDQRLENLTEDQQVLVLSLSEPLGRIDVKANLGNKRVSPEAFCRHISKKVEELNDQLGEKDRELYEQFLMNTLRDSIRQKIHYVRNWEREINRFLNEGNSIRFRLKWVPRERESEEELKTRELVEALSRDQQWIDKNTITKHFKAKIKQAKRSFEENTDGNKNLRTLITDVMDYRKWHDFELYFTKQGGNETLLTRKSVTALSGGQQVLSVVAPILAALHAKYLEANGDTVRIFTLDEAFARVDDDNKEAMFEYIRNLDFDYIINSQELWGTYETVPELDIFELMRPKNRPAVSVIAYHWNGATSVKTLIQPEEKLIAVSSDPNS